MSNSYYYSLPEVEADSVKSCKMPEALRYIVKSFVSNASTPESNHK